MWPHLARCAACQLPVLKHPRQILASRTAWIIHVVCNLLRALGSQFIEPIDELGIAATVTNETGHDIAAIPRTFLTSDAQHFGLAEEIAEDDCAVAGYGDHDRIENATCWLNRSLDFDV
jgi:hypothetical protein